MKKSELKQLIKEELKNILNESENIPFNKVKENQNFYITYESGKWIYYKKKKQKIGNNNAIILGTYDNDKRAIGNQVYIDDFRIVNVIDIK